MRYPILTLHNENDIEFTATVEENEAEFFSGKSVSGTVIYIEQWNCEKDDWAAASILLKDDGTLEILKSCLFKSEEVSYFLDLLKVMRNDIDDHVRRERDTSGG